MTIMIAYAAAVTPRRLGVAAVLWPVLTLVLVTLGGGAWLGAASDVALLLTVTLLAAVLLATYVPLDSTAGRLDLGCTRCAAAAWLSVVLAGVLFSQTAPGSEGAVFPLLVLGMGLGQRLRGAAVCVTAPSRAGSTPS